MKKNIFLALLIVFIIGCSTAGVKVANKPLESRLPKNAFSNKSTNTVIYISDTQSIPAYVLQNNKYSNTSTNTTKNFNALLDLANNALNVVPEISEDNFKINSGFIRLRETSGTVSREIYLNGLNKKEQLDSVIELLEVWSDYYNRSILDINN